MTVDEQHMVQELMDTDSGLHPSEIKCLEELNDNWDKSLSPGEKIWLEKIWQRVLR